MEFETGRDILPQASYFNLKTAYSGYIMINIEKTEQLVKNVGLIASGFCFFDGFRKKQTV